MNNSRSLNSAYNGQQMYFSATPISNKPFYERAICNSTLIKTPINPENGNIFASRKRCIDSIDEFYVGADFPTTQKSNIQMQSYELEMDDIISQHVKRMKLEIQERQKQLIATIEKGMAKKLNENDEQIQEMLKLNTLLQDKVRSLYFENQLWKDMTKKTEATVISLHTNFKHALTQFGGAERMFDRVRGVAPMVDDAESCCDNSDKVYYNNKIEKSGYGVRRCRLCGEREACVLLLPCRHLCLCNDCGSVTNQVQTCPVCNSTMNATVHVKM